MGDAVGTLGGDHAGIRAGGLNGAYMGIGVSGSVSAVSSPARAAGDRLFTAPPGTRIVTLNQQYQAPLEAPLFISLPGASYFAEARAGTTTTVETMAVEPAGAASGAIAKAFSGRVSEFVANPWAMRGQQKLAAVAAPLMQSAPAAASSVGSFQTAARPSDVEDGIIGKLKASVGVEVASRFLPRTRTLTVDALDLEVSPFSHPFAHDFVRTLKRDGLSALLDPAMQTRTVAASATFAGACAPNADRVAPPGAEGVEFGAETAYGNYNWEVFFHAPMLLYRRLVENNQLDAALDVFHHVFDPVASGGRPDDAWRFTGLRRARALRIDGIFAALGKPDGDPERASVLAQITAMRLFPFEAHRIARLRPGAYKRWALAEYVRLRIARGDAAFQRFPDPELVNLATPEYIVAKEVLGPRPEMVPQRATMPAMTYAELRPHLDALGNVVYTAETELFGVAPAAGLGGDRIASGAVQRASVGYFGIPKNEKLLALWDEVDDRLFKLRNGMNLEGVQMQMPLFPPRIDPALLAAAAAAGLDIREAADALDAPLPSHRYRVLHRQAVELAEQVVRLGAALSEAREKRDTEDLSLRRATHETAMAAAVRQVGLERVREAESALVAARADRDAPVTRWRHYRGLLGAKLEEPSLKALADKKNVFGSPQRNLLLVPADQVKFDALTVLPGLRIQFDGVGPVGGFDKTLRSRLDQATGGVALVGGSVLQEEKAELEESFESVKRTYEAAELDLLASVLGLIPNFEAAVKPFGAGAAIHLGGQALAAAASAASRNKHAAGAMHSFVASVYGKQAAYVLRERDWVLQLNQAAEDALRAERQAIVAEIRVAVARGEQANQEKAFNHASEIEETLRTKFSTAELYDFRIAQQLQLFRRFFDLALERARQAEACYGYEREARRFVTVGRPQTAREELAAGHQLLAALAEMDRSFHATDERKPELVRQVSLRQIAPAALASLRESGRADFKIPEVLFDIDHPRHYDRRLTSVQVTISRVAEPTAPITGTLTLKRSFRRLKPGADLVEDRGGAVSVALSTGREDAGVFELSLQDDLYLPAEGRGVITEWLLALPYPIRHYNYRTISDVWLTLRYTAKPGRAADADEAAERIRDGLNAISGPGETAGAVQMLSLRHDFGDTWYELLRSAGTTATIEIGEDVLPYLLRAAFEPELQAVHWRPLPRGKPAPEAFEEVVPVLLDEAADGPDRGRRWSVELDLPAVRGLDDVELLARFAVGLR
ncbi:hypothetical protein N177_3051 [Lutibaculum baratangense AMV1]|uniref:Tc toxin complex TcA C-terminal TcB-binding domain-containing protein n=1 Tax=Lutibaculum baratangense AMV1 TaxID=631454 RepID=V4T8V9_9HYPH|nr:hypothetical protein N177_3051 [Lutibaculum baratangense AMV1]